MINRILIRIKVVQMVYSYLLTEKERTIEDAKNELNKSLDKAYELYNGIFVLLCDLTRLQDLRIDAARNKYLPTEADLNPSTRFIDNELIKTLHKNEDLQEYLKENPITWQDDDIFLRLMLDKILNSDIYKQYIDAETTDFKTDCEFWRNILKKIILVDEDFAELLESKSVYWNDDLCSTSTFVLKTLKRIEDGAANQLLPMYKNDEDKMFGENLFLLTLRNKKYYNELIDKFVQTESWDSERIAFMDRVIMIVGIAEIINFESIPTTVTLNEYIEITKYYSTMKSSQFVNGILNSIINYLKDEGKLLKN
ncbi:MAG: transcription antitermination protein NusB [Muribaculaceae bacterium]